MQFTEDCPEGTALLTVILLWPKSILINCTYSMFKSPVANKECQSIALFMGVILQLTKILGYLFSISERS